MLYTVVFLALMAQRRGWFDLRSMLLATEAKMIRRHPHVFGRKRARSADDAYRYWEEAKRQEQASRRGPTRLFQQSTRTLLVEICELLRVHPEAQDLLQRTVTDLLKEAGTRANETPRRASGSQAPGSARSPGRGAGPGVVG